MTPVSSPYKLLWDGSSWFVGLHAALDLGFPSRVDFQLRRGDLALVEAEQQAVSQLRPILLGQLHHAIENFRFKRHLQEG